MCNKRVVIVRQGISTGYVALVASNQLITAKPAVMLHSLSSGLWQIRCEVAVVKIIYFVVKEKGKIKKRYEPIKLERYECKWMIEKNKWLLISNKQDWTNDSWSQNKQDYIFIQPRGCWTVRMSLNYFGHHCCRPNDVICDQWKKYFWWYGHHCCRHTSSNNSC
jgi:hypothetical protein